LNALGFIRSDLPNELATTHEKMIIVYGIQRRNVKNCFYEETSWRAMNPTGEKQKSPAYR
jgi:hypothetical protein